MIRKVIIPVLLAAAVSVWTGCSDDEARVESPGSQDSAVSQSGSTGSAVSQSGSTGSAVSQSGSTGSAVSQSGSTGSAVSQSGSAGSTASQSGSAGSAASQSSSGSAVTAADFDQFIVSLGEPLLQSAIDPPRQSGDPVTNFSSSEMTVSAVWEVRRDFPVRPLPVALRPVSWPGALINAVTAGQPEAVAADVIRNHAVYTVVLSGGGGSFTGAVARPESSSVSSVVQGIVASQAGAGRQADHAFQVTAIHSPQHLQAVTGLTGTAEAAQLDQVFAFSGEPVATRVLLVWQQVYYSVEMTVPPVPSGLFPADSDWSSLIGRFAGVLPGCIGRVNYGRTVYAAVLSGESRDAVTAALSNCSAGIIADGGLQISEADKGLLDRAVVKVSVVDGAGISQVHTVQGFAGLKAMLTAGAVYDSGVTGAPVSYTLRLLSNGSTVPAQYYAVYPVETRSSALRTFSVGGAQLICDSVDDAGGKGEFYGNCSVRVFTNGVPVQGFRDGAPAGPVFWDVPEVLAGLYPLGPGESRFFPGSMLRFTVHLQQLDAALLTVEATVTEDDDFGDDYLGRYAATNRLVQVPLNTLQFVTGFSEPGTAVRVGYTLSRD